MSFQNETEDRNQSLVDHLTELRVRLMRALGVILVGTFVAFHYAEHLFNLIRKPIQPYLPQGGLIYTGPIDKFMAYIKLAIVAGVILTCPLWLWQVWRFVAPGLYRKEKTYAAGFIFFGSVLFISGVVFSYMVVLPMAFHFLMTFGGEADKPMIAIDSYLSFVTQITLMFGVSFELPLILVILSMMDLVSRKFLSEKRRYAIMIMAVISAIVTPPDLVSMLLMLGPMWFLYEFGLVLVGIVERRKASQQRQSQRE